MLQTWTRYLPGFIRQRIETNPLLQDIIGNTGWMMGDRIVRKAVSLLVGVLMARYFGPQLYGEFSYAIAFVLLFSPVAMLALDAVTIPRMVRNSADKDEVLGTAFLLMTLGGVLAFFLAAGAIFLVRPYDSLSHWLVTILAGATIVQAFIAIEFWFESQMQWKFTVYAKTSAFLLLSMVKIGFILFKMPLVAFAWAGLAETVAGSAGLIIVYHFRGYAVRAWRFSMSLGKSMLRDGWPLIVSAILTMTYLRIDQIMIGNMIGSKELGLYSVAVQISEVWYFIPMAICSSVFPAIVKAEAHSEELFYSRLQRLYNLMVLLSYGIAIPVAFFADEIIVFLFSAAYRDAGPLLTILIWTGIFTSLGAARNLLIVAKNWTRVNLVSIALGCTTNIFLNVMLIPQYGAMGAVVATFISYWFTIHGTCFFFKSLRPTGRMMTKAMIFPKVW